MDTIKALAVDDLPEEAWRILLGKSELDKNAVKIQNEVGYLYRAVDLRSDAVANMPFVIKNKAGDVVDSSDEYKNVTGVLPNPVGFFGLTEMALTTWGASYAFKSKNLFGFSKGLRYLLYDSIKVEFEKDGTPKFKRRVDGRDKDFSVDDILYLWKPDPRVEIGPPNRSPIGGAMSAAGVKWNAHQFAAAYWERGAIKATLLRMSGNPKQSEKDRIKSLWSRLMKGMRAVFGEMVINADAMEPVIIGEGLEGITNRDLNDEQREEISTALGVPHSLLFSGAANFSVSDKDDLHFYDKTIVPECRFISRNMNQQVFLPMGYELEFTPEALDIYQEDENERAQAMSQFTDAITKAQTFDLVQAIINIFGVEVNEEDLRHIEAHFQTVDERRKETQERMFETRGGFGGPNQDKEKKDEDGGPGRRSGDLDKWRRKALKSFRRGDGAIVEFISDELDPLKMAYIEGALLDAETEDDILQAFSLSDYL